MTAIVRLSEGDLVSRTPQLIALLRDAVEDGAAVGFLSPLGEQEAAAYWASVVLAVAERRRMVLGALGDGGVVGGVQLELPSLPGAAHRAEVTQLIVHRRVRRQGIARRLMRAAEDAALKDRRTLLVLDTRAGDLAERLCTGLGWRRAGVIPRHARSADGTLLDTAILWKELHGPG